jgi:POLQ-like helicase
MKPEAGSRILLAMTRSKAKMYEYSIPSQHHIALPKRPARLFSLAIGLVGDYARAYVDAGNLLASPNGELPGLRFAAQFFDSFDQTNLDEASRSYVRTMSAATYYLCELPGSSRVVAKQLQVDGLDLECEGMEGFLIRLLRNDSVSTGYPENSYLGKILISLSKKWNAFLSTGAGVGTLQEELLELRVLALEAGTPRQILFSDLLAAVLLKRVSNSVWTRIPQFSELSIDDWRPTFEKPSFVKELWPSQRLLGEKGVFAGRSAVIQMPTSAGKTKAVEFVIRSHFLRKQSQLVVVVAPFRALCNEIRDSLKHAFKDEAVSVDALSDILQFDLDVEGLISTDQILVVTPEKFLYVVRQQPELAEKIGLLVFDEGHQFDSGTRGVTYELLITSLNMLVSKSAQRILISAVISNAEQIGSWLSGTDSNVVAGQQLSPTFRTIAFASWKDQRGMLQFVPQENPDQVEFFVPRVIESFKLRLKGRETKKRKFPEKGDGSSVALYLGFKLVPKGAIAIFVGRKDSANKLCEDALNVFERSEDFKRPVDYSDPIEVQRLENLYTANLGSAASTTKSARIGIYAHHGNTPHGIRLAIEHAVKENKVKFVICTSTLAQGVNLPIRYLIITSIYQGGEKIKVRDFHNLLGRAGRSGMHTEGSIIFADNDLFDSSQVRDKRWRWEAAKKMLDPKMAEPCVSAILILFKPLESDDAKSMFIMEPLAFVENYIEDPNEVDKLPEELAAGREAQKFSVGGLRRQIEAKMKIIGAIESFILSHVDLVDEVERLAENTLGYFMADDPQKGVIKSLFRMLADNLAKLVDEPVSRKALGKTLLGAKDIQAVRTWVEINQKQLESAETFDELLEVCWPILKSYISNTTFRRCSSDEALKNVVKAWMAGRSFEALLAILLDAKARIVDGRGERVPSVEHVVDICESGLSHDGPLIVGAISEVLKILLGDSYTWEANLVRFQRKLRYGLPSQTTINYFEMGFADRVIAQELASVFGGSLSKDDIKKLIQIAPALFRYALDKYPSYFSQVFETIRV